MSSRELYKRFTSLCSKWPKDASKEGRDYGEMFRAQLAAYFPQGDLGQVKEPAKVELALSSLERIASNIYFDENPLKRSSSSGLEAGACSEAISNDGIRIIQEQEESTLLSRIKKNLSMEFTQSEINYKVIRDPDGTEIEKKSDQKRPDV